MKRRWFGVLLTLFASLYPLLATMPAEAVSTAPGGLSGSVTYDGKPCEANSTVNIDGRTYPVNDGRFTTGPTLTPGTKSIVINCYVGGTQHTFTQAALAAGGPITVTSGTMTDTGQLNGAANPNQTQVDCNAGAAFSWVICGLIKVTVEMIDAIRVNVIVPFLRSTPLDRNQEEFKAAYELWSAFRNVSSIFFILVFFLVIIGTAAGFDNYTVKKIMPHLVAGAILIPFSWYFCAFIIDIGNVLGAGIVALVTAALNTAGATVTIDLTSSFTALFLGGVGAAGGFALYTGAATIGLGVVISVAIAFLGVFLTLIFRKIMIMIAVIISPLAILAWVLPNTSKWFSEWWKMFFKLVMMYPIIIMLFEAGRIFSATAGATYTSAVGADWVTPLFQIMGLILPLFMVPFAFKYAGKGLSMGAGAIDKFSGNLDKRFGKDSAGAKMAAKNREIKNMERGRIMGEKAKESPSRLGRLGNTMASRAAYRRAGHAAPMRTKAKGFMSNPSKLIEHEDAYGAAMAALGKASSTDEKKKQNLPGESAAARLTAETQAALNNKIEGQAARAGLVRQAQELGTDGLGAANREILEAGADQKRKQLLDKAGNAKGYNQASALKPLNADDVMNRAAKMAEASEVEARGTLHGELEMSVELDKKVVRDAAKEGKSITMADAHRMRMENLARAADTNAGNRQIGRDTDALTTNNYSDMATQAEIDRSAAQGVAISRGMALNNRLDGYMAATVSKGVNKKLADEGEDLAYNEVEAEAGGRLSGMEIMASARANARQGLADNRAKLETGVVGDRVSTGTMLETSRNTTFRNLAGKEGNIAGQALNMENQAKLDGIPLTTPGGRLNANLAAADRTYKAGAIGGSEHDAEKSAHERAEINVSDADARNSGLTPGSDTALRHAAAVAGKAALITKEKQLSEHMAQEEAIIDADKKVHVRPEDYMAAGRDEQARQLVERASGVIAANKQLKGDVDAEMAANPGMSPSAAEATVRGRRLDNVKETALLKGATNSAASVRAEAETAQAARRIVGAESAKIAANPATPPGTDIKAQALQNIANARADVTGRAAGVKLTEDVEGDLGAAETLDTNVNNIMNDPANKGISREAAKQLLQNKTFTEAGNAARDISSRRLQTEMSTKEGGSYGAELSIKNQMEADEKNPDLPSLPPDQARARAKATILKAVGTDARNTAAENRIAVTRKAKGAAENYEAALEIQSERDYIAPQKQAASDAKRRELEDKNEFEVIKNKKINEFRSTADADTLADAEKMDQVERDAEEFAKTEIEARVEQAGNERAAELRNDIDNGDISVPFDRSAAEAALFSAAGDAAEEQAGVDEATTQGRRIAYSEAFQSDRRTPDKARIQGTIRTSIDQRAREAATAKVKEREKPRSFDVAYESNLNVEQQKQMKIRTEEASKMRFSELDSDYQKALLDVGNGDNPFGNLPIGEVDQNSAGNAGLAAVVKEAIKKKDWHIAQSALEHLSATNGGFDIAKKIQSTPVAQGGFGGSTTDQVDRNNADASMLKYIWDQSIGIASKGNPDANKPILVAAKDWKAEKLSSVNDKFMGRVLKFYSQDKPEFESRLSQSEAAFNDVKARKVAEDSTEYKRAEAAYKDAKGQFEIIKRAQADFQKASRALLDHPQLEFNPDALRALKDNVNSDASVIDDPDLIRDINLAYEGNYQKKESGGQEKKTKGTKPPKIDPDDPVPTA